LEDDLLHLFNVGCLLAFGWFPLSIGLPSPSTSRGVIASGFVLAGYFLEAARSVFMPEVIAILALLHKACAFISRVPHNIAEFAEGRVVLQEGFATCWGNAAHE